MMIQLEVEVRIRKGLGPDFFIKNFPVGYDDLPEDTSIGDIERMAKYEVDSILRNSEDYRQYGHNWEIINYIYS